MITHSIFACTTNTTGKCEIPKEESTIAMYKTITTNQFTSFLVFLQMDIDSVYTIAELVEHIMLSMITNMEDLRACDISRYPTFLSTGMWGRKPGSHVKQKDVNNLSGLNAKTKQRVLFHLPT